MNPLVPMHGNRWRGDPEARAAAVRALEEGAILYLPERGFGIEEGEARLFSDEFPCPGAKSFSYDPCRAEVGGPSALRGAPAADRAALGAMMSRYARFCRDLCTSLLGEYGERLSLARTSFRPVEVAGRDSRGVKSDDTLLHVDSFPATPTAGRRILRVFCNVSPVGRSRVWHVGERFEDVAARFAPRLRIPWPGERTLLRMLGVTAGDRTPYDHYMLRLHDCMKRDLAYQRAAPRSRVEMAAGATWICFTDQVSHAALSGRYALEQTLHCRVDDMARPEQSPLRILEALLRRPLI